MSDYVAWIVRLSLAGWLAGLSCRIVSRIVSDCVGSNVAGFVASNGMRESGAILAEMAFAIL